MENVFEPKYDYVNFSRKVKKVKEKMVGEMDRKKKYDEEIALFLKRPVRNETKRNYKRQKKSWKRSMLSKPGYCALEALIQHG